MAVKGERKRKKTDFTVNDIPRVGPDTPAGEWFRRYWLVVGTVEDLRDIPQAVKILGEELVLFRDRKGQLGLLGLHCPHRGASLEYGDIEEKGIRCPYHDWLFDVSGQCLEQPAEPKGSFFYQKIKHLSYPVRELGGLIFTYMGSDREDPPPLPRYSPLIDHGGLRQIEPVRHFNYNWFNFYENSADPTHVCILHRNSGYGDQTWGDRFFSYHDMPEFEPVETDYGMKIVMTKPGPLPNTKFVDTMSLAFPSIIQIGDTEFIHAKVNATSLFNEGSHCEHTLFLTPKDDDNFTLYTVNYYTGSDPDFFVKLDQMRKKEVPPQEVMNYDKRKHMPFRGNVRQEDIVTQGTQPLLGERMESLGSADRGIIKFRRLVLEAMETVKKGKKPKGVLPLERADEFYQIDSFVGVLPISASKKGA